MKNFKWKSKYWWAVGGGAVLTSLIVHYKRQYDLLEKTSFKPAGFAPNKLTLNEADFNIKLKMNNDSAVDYYLKDQVYNLYINNSFVAVIRNPNQIYVAPEKSTDIWLNVKFNPMNVKNLSWLQIKEMLLKNSSLAIQLKGNAKVKLLNGVFSFDYPVDETFTMKDLQNS